jgi:hypothetical protein
MRWQDQKSGKVPVRLQTRFSLQRSGAAAFPFVIGWSVMPPQPQKPNADAIMRAMSDYVAGLKEICLAYDAGVEFVTDGQQKIQFVSSGQVMIDRPDTFRVSRSGGYADVDFQVDALPKSASQPVQDLEGEFSLQLPGAELLSDNAYDALMSGVVDARYIGRIAIDGVECEHLAFRNKDVDWQLWVQVAPRPIPRRYVVTSKMIEGAPQYTLHIRDWKTGVSARTESSGFQTPADKKIDFVAFLDLREWLAGFQLAPVH